MIKIGEKKSKGPKRASDRQEPIFRGVWPDPIGSSGHADDKTLVSLIKG